jgi:hypothetical protein
MWITAGLLILTLALYGLAAAFRSLRLQRSVEPIGLISQEVVDGELSESLYP